MRAIAEKGARLAEDKGEFERARIWHGLVGRWCRRLETRRRESGADCGGGVVPAAGRTVLDPGQKMQASLLLGKAHEVYRNIPDMRPTAKEVYAQLREIQRQTVQHLGQITTEIPNASELIEHARSWVAGKTLREALLALATVSWVTDIEKEPRPFGK